MRVVFVGPGRAGIALGRVLRGGGCAVALHYVGRRERAPATDFFASGNVEYSSSLAEVRGRPGVLVLSVPDDALAGAVSDVLQVGPGAGWSVLHLSGMHDTSILAPLRRAGYAVGTLHPLQALSRTETALELLPESSFVISGDETAADAARAIVACLGGRALAIPDPGRPLYHAAATLIAQGIPVLVEAASRWMAQAGGDQEAAREGLQGLLEGVVANMRTEGLGAATGPLVRGDVQTVARHLQTLAGSDRALYTQISRALLRAMAPRMSDEHLSAFDTLLKEYE